jgi:hypothetical protein
MPRAIPVPVRQQIWSRFQNGESAAAIAAALHLRPRTVQLLVQRLQRLGPKGMEPWYRAPVRGAQVGQHLADEALVLHEQHPSWGAGFIRVRLEMRHPELTMPSERTLQRWFRRTRLPLAPAGRKPIPQRQAAGSPHEIWQMDASEHIPLATGQRVSWLRCVDEFTGAVLGTRVFPPRALESGASHGDATLSAATISALGSSCWLACGQRHSLGKLE